MIAGNIYVLLMFFYLVLRMSKMFRSQKVINKFREDAVAVEQFRY